MYGFHEDDPHRAICYNARRTQGVRWRRPTVGGNTVDRDKPSMRQRAILIVSSDWWVVRATLRACRLVARTHRSRHCSDSVRYLRHFCRADEASGKLLTQFHRSLLQCSSDSGPTTVGRGMANQTWTSDSASLHHGRIPAVSRPWLTRSRYEAFHGKLKRMSVIVRSGKVAVKSARVWRASSMRPART
jgi:hypothetical protein